MTPHLYLEQASSTAGQVDLLLVFLLAVTAFFLAVVFIPMAFFLYKYRRGNPANRAAPNITTWKVELVWSVIPLMIGVVIFGWGAQLYYQLETAPTNPMEVHVIGKQWMWYIQHAEGKREINALHVPVGRTTKLVMTSQDVIHDFYVPAFRTKQDVVPGKYTSEWFTPTRVGTYHLFCSEYCGTGHSQMIGEIVVQTPDEYEEWLHRDPPQASMAQSGEKLYHSLGCSGCHGVSSTIRAPSLSGLYGQPVPLQGGTIVQADEHYLRDSILLPQKQIVAGYAPVMPSYQGQVTEAEIFEIVQYLKSIGSHPSNERP